MDDQRRNLNPHAEAIAAMYLYGPDYSAQNGGSMDFWDRLSESRRRTCRELVERIKRETKRAPASRCATPPHP